MKRALVFLWTNRTRTLGFIGGVLGILAASTDIFSPQAIKYMLLTGSLLTYAVGQFNSWQANRQGP
jgi:hypothetical protein